MAQATKIQQFASNRLTPSLIQFSKGYRLSPERFQTTIKRSTFISGFGFWSGLDVHVEFRPAPAGHGIVFVRRDLPGMPCIPAQVENRIEGPRRTTLSRRGSNVEMVEHVLAALAGLQIDNCQIWIDRAEMPGLDGSSQEIVNALLAVGTQRLPGRRQNLRIDTAIRVGDDDAWISAEPADGNECVLRYELNYSDEPAIGRQTCTASLGSLDFANAIAPARTFVTLNEAESLRREGLARRVSYSDLLVFNHQGVLQNTLRYENECARHKLLDLIGDLSLAGCDLIGSISAYRSGHRLNAELVRQLLATHAQFNPLKRSA